MKKSNGCMKMMVGCLAIRSEYLAIRIYSTQIRRSIYSLTSTVKTIMAYFNNFSPIICVPTVSIDRQTNSGIKKSAGFVFVKRIVNMKKVYYTYAIYL